MVILLSVLIVLLPLAFFLTVMIGEVQQLIEHREAILAAVQSLDETFPRLQLIERVESFIGRIGGTITSLAVSALQDLSNRFINILIAAFVLYYMLITPYEVKRRHLKAVIPFNEKNTTRLLQEFESVTHSTIISTGVIAVMQGLLITLTFVIFGVPGAVFWGAVSAFLSFLPVVGTPLVWVPAGVIYLFRQDVVAGIGILVAGVIISSLDNFIRPYLQQKVGRMHPFISLLGIFIGLPLFGLIGIVVGPLLLSFLLLMVKMFNEEYLLKKARH
jgi:predicted PurR-regulated permease PerM